MRKVLTLAGKDLLLLVRDRAGFFFTFFFPLLMAVFFGTIFSGGGGENGRTMPVILVDEDSTGASAEFIERLSASEALRVERALRPVAEERVRLGTRVAFIVVTRGFGEARSRLFWGDAPRVVVGVDPSRRAEAGLIEGVLMQHAAAAMSETMSDDRLMSGTVRRALDSLDRAASGGFAPQAELRRFLESFDRFLADTAGSAARGGGGQADSAFRGFTPLVIDRADVARLRTGPANAYEISFPQGIVWGMIACAAAFSISLVLERTRGTLVRLLVAPISRAQILAGKALACYATTLVISATLLLVARLVFGVSPGSAMHAAAAVISVGSAFVGIMMLLSVIGKTERSAGGIGWAALLVMAMIGGGMIPLFIMPEWMQTLSHVSPVKWSILALEGALWRNFTALEMALPCGILLGIGAVCFAAGVRLFRWTS